jgi:hypothetical protein
MQCDGKLFGRFTSGTEHRNETPTGTWQSDDLPFPVFTNWSGFTTRASCTNTITCTLNTKLVDGTNFLVSRF